MNRRQGLLRYLVIGAAFGIVLVKAEVVSWYRIQEMFRFQSFHMFGIIGSALAVAALSIRLLSRGGRRAATGEMIALPPKDMGSGARYAIGGTLFGLGWGLSGACPGPIFALIGAGYGSALVLLLSAMLGAWVYAWLRPRLPA